MNSKTIVLLLCVGVCCVAASPSGNPWAKKKCGDDQACRDAMKECFGGSFKMPKEESSHSPSEKLAAFNTCLQDNGQGSNTIEEATCLDGGNQGEGGEGNHHHHEKCMKEIIGVFKGMDETTAGLVRCCWSNKISSEMVTENNSINLEFFKQKTRNHITDPKIVAIHESAMDACQAEGDQCNIYAFMNCVINQCIEEVKSVQ